MGHLHSGRVCPAVFLPNHAETPHGSGQVYDYWSDPWGRVHERWADTDRLNAQSGSNLLPAHEALSSQWGEPPPERFISRISS